MTSMGYSEIVDAEFCFADIVYGECRYAECRLAIVATLNKHSGPNYGEQANIFFLRKTICSPLYY
jgi:hypothetical protein